MKNITMYNVLAFDTEGIIWNRFFKSKKNAQTFLERNLGPRAIADIKSYGYHNYHKTNFWCYLKKIKVRG